MKSLEECHVEGLLALSANVPSSLDAFEAHLGVLGQASIDEGHQALIDALDAAAWELGRLNHSSVERVKKHIAKQRDQAYHANAARMQRRRA